MTPIRVLIVDDNAACREALRFVLEAAPDIEIVAEAGSGEAAVQEACNRQPDVVLMDVQMPGMDGIEATRQLTRCVAQAQVICLTAYPVLHDEALAAGASHFLLKDSPAQELIDVIRGTARPLVY